MALNERVFQEILNKGITPSMLHKGAQENANSAWLFAATTGIVWFFVDNSWWMLPPIFLTVWSIYRSVSATKMAIRLEDHLNGK